MSARNATPGGTEAALRALLARDGNDAGAWLQLAALRLKAGDPAEAVRAFDRAAKLGVPPRVRAHDHALALSNSGDQVAAEQMLLQVAQAAPPDHPRLLLHGVVVKRAGRPREAIPLFEAARDLAPADPAAWHNLGNTYQQLGQPAEAATAYREAARLQPGQAGAARLLAVALRDAGEAEAAAAAFTEALALRPGDFDIAQEALLFLLGAGKRPEAEALVARFGAADPSDAATLLEGRLLLWTGRRDAAIALLDAAIAAPAPDRRLFIMLAGAHGDADRDAANRVLRAGLACHPQAADLASALCESLNRSRGPAEADNIQAAYAVACDLTDRGTPGLLQHAFTLRSLFRRCADFDRLAKVGPVEAVAPGWIAGNRVAGLHNELGNVTTLADRLRLVDWHRDWGRRLQGRVAPLPGAPGSPWVKGSRRIRVGFMSSDLRHHPVSYFALHLLDSFDRERFEVFAYSFYEKQKDAVQAHIESRVTGFRWWPHRPDAEVAAGIRQDNLDILFELGGSTAMNKLEVMAYRPARIGASWLGYPHSAGIERIDYILTDPFIEPEDPRLLIEKPFRLPESWVALGRIGFTDAPIAEGIPEERHGRLTFGTMNNPMKYTAACFDAWAAVLRAVPGARFLFVRPEGGTPAFRENIAAGFAARGVDPDRIAHVPIRGDHLKHYNDIDIALDTFPHVGGTTTCETLWMGVPVVTKVGPAFQERLSYSNLSNAGLPELCARTTEDYIAKAIALAQDRPLRRAMRAGLRGMIRLKPLGQVERFTRAFYARVAQVAAE
ncbi:MAG TPA: tetratricopeptide repeat protein [Roseomonas sp.]|jgi:predicted O-linked N-acetylglucosamine transferase (SPINDLY family)